MTKIPYKITLMELFLQGASKVSKLSFYCQCLFIAHKTTNVAFKGGL